MVSMVKQIIETEESRNETIQTLINLLESTIIDDGIQGLSEPKYTSVWSEEQQEVIKSILLRLIKTIKP